MVWSIFHTRSTSSVGWVTRWSWILRIMGLYRSLCKDKRLCSGVTMSPWLLTLTKKGWKTWGGLDCVFTCLRVKVCNGPRGSFTCSAAWELWALCMMSESCSWSWESLDDSPSNYSAMALSYFTTDPASVPKHTHFSHVTLGLRKSPSTVLLIF